MPCASAAAANRGEGRRWFASKNLDFVMPKMMTYLGFLTLSLLFSCARRQVGGHGPVVSLHGTSMVAKPIDSKRQECKFYQVSDLGQIC